MLQLRNATTNKPPQWLVEKKYVIGTGGDCDIKIADASVSAQHAELEINGDEVVIVNSSGAENVTVNGKVVKIKALIKPGDDIRIGADTLQLVDPKSTPRPAKKEPEAPQGWALKALNTALEDKHFPMKGAQVIGRSQECDISLGVVHLSRKHAKVTVTDKGLKVEDLNSSNGTYVNGKKVNQAVVISGDELSFDTLRFRVIGPIIDQDKTELRPSSDGEMTTIRPALTIPQAKGSAKPAAAASASAKPKPKKLAPTARAKTATQPTPSPEPVASSGGSGGVIFVVIGVLIVVGAGAAWFLTR